MAKDSPKPEAKKGPTPFDKFAQLAKRVATAPKDREKPKEDSSSRHLT